MASLLAMEIREIGGGGDAGSDCMKERKEIPPDVTLVEVKLGPESDNKDKETGTNNIVPGKKRGRFFGRKTAGGDKGITIIKKLNYLSFKDKTVGPKGKKQSLKVSVTNGPGVEADVNKKAEKMEKDEKLKPKRGKFIVA
jgi:hypothetical protein